MGASENSSGRLEGGNWCLLLDSDREGTEKHERSDVVEAPLGASEEYRGKLGAVAKLATVA